MISGQKLKQNQTVENVILLVKRSWLTGIGAVGLVRADAELGSPRLR